MTTCCRGTFSTLSDTYSLPKELTTVKENWMGGPVRNNFTGCGGPGWNANKPPCTQCYLNGQGSRWCNQCSPQNQITKAAGGNPASWLPADV